MLPGAFLKKDEAVQKRAALLLTAFSEPTKELRADLLKVETNILMTIRPLLKAYLSDEHLTSETTYNKEAAAIKRNQLSEETKIPIPGTPKDLAFHLNKTFEFQSPTDFDLSLNELVKQTGEINEEKLVLFETTLKKAYKLYIEHRNQTDIRYVYDVCLIHYSEYLQQQYPGSLAFLNKLKEKAREASEKFSTHSYKRNFIPFEPLNKIPVDNPATDVFLQLGLYALNKIKKGELLPLLSTPTHYPAWIDPVVLVERLSLYEQQNIPVNELDFQLAIQRCALDNTDKAIRLVADKLSGEEARLINYFLQLEGIPKGPFELLPCWVTAGIIRKGKLEEVWKESIYKRIPAGYLSGVHLMETRPAQRDPNQYIVGFTTGNYHPKNEPERLFMEYNGNTLAPMEVTTPTMILTNPNRPANVYREILEKVTRYSDLSWEVEEIKTILTGLQLMRELHNPYRDMEYGMLAVAILSKSKDVQNLAWQIWIEDTEANRIDNRRFGKLIGIIEAGEVYPVKRYTDMVNTLISQLDTTHLPALHELTEGILLQLPETPIRNLKKVLETYRELLLLTNKKADYDTIPQLKSWQKILSV